jgi:hypothetical protein
LLLQLLLQCAAAVLSAVAAAAVALRILPRPQLLLLLPALRLAPSTTISLRLCLQRTPC